MRSKRWRWIPLSATVLAATGCWAQGEPASVGGPDASVPAEGQVVRSAVSPPPIIGGTLLMIEDGNTAVASDPDRDLVHVVDLVHAEVRHTLELPRGDQPGRLAVDADGRVHVVARRGGVVIDLDPRAGTILDRRTVCPNPRGIAFDPELDALHVACAGGALVTLPAAGGAPTRHITVTPDLRDVLVTDQGLMVSRFRTADLLRLDDDGTVVERMGLPMLERESVSNSGLNVERLEPNTAWRTIPTSDGDWLMLHQASTTRTLSAVQRSDSPDDTDGTTSSDDGDTFEGATLGGGTFGNGFGEAGGGDTFGDGFGGGPGDPGGGGGYGSVAGQCVGAVHPVLTLGRGDIDSRHSPLLDQTVLPVDVAVSSSGLVAMAVAGIRTNLTASGRGGVVSMSLDGFAHTTESGCITPREIHMGEGQFVAVAFDWTDRVVAQSREPALIACMDPVGNRPTIIELPGAARRDTGHDLFHLDAGGGIACATCHAEGGDDGRVWSFEGLGMRHTPALAIGLAGTEPFHWQGDLANMTELMREIHDDRMGGRPLSEAHVDALQSWLFALAPPQPLRGPEDAAVGRGEALFGAWGCGSCHAGLAMARQGSVELGVGFAVQVPGLHGVALHPPYMHDGRAADLTEAVYDMLDRTRAGAPAPSDAEVDDVVAYLESL